MQPEVFELFGRPIRWYGILMAASMLITLFWAVKLMKQRKLDGDQLWEGAFLMIIAGVFGARLVYVVTSWGNDFAPLMADGLQASDLYEIVAFWNGGISIHGSVIFGCIAAWWFFRNRPVSFMQVTDSIAPGVSLGVFLVRFGNFMNGDITGWKVEKVPWSDPSSWDFPSKIPWAMNFPYDEWHAQVGAYGDPSVIIWRHPTEIYGMIVGLVTFLVVWYLYRKKLYDGVCFYGWIITYSLTRSLIEEPFRAVHWHWPVAGGPEYGWQIFTMTQLVSIPLVIGSIFLTIYTRNLFLKKREKYQKQGIPYALYVAHERGIKLSKEQLEALGIPRKIKPPVEWEMGRAYELSRKSQPKAA